MSATIVGKLGALDLEWLSVPRGLQGAGRVRVGKDIWDVSWRKDSHGVWVEFPHGTFGFDLIAEKDEDGRVLYRLKSRKGPEIHAGLHFMRAGEATAEGSGPAKKKSVRVRAQMPGKIVRLHVKAGDFVEKDQVLLVMEAMKMENPIKAPQAGMVSTVAVTEGQAVETGADLLQLGE
jgi:biotin carboxyl carrier protein